MAIADNTQNLFAEFRCSFRKDLVDGTADHKANEFRLRHFRDLSCAHHLPVPKDRVAVGDTEDLVELVADEEDRLALGFEPFDELVGLLDLLVREGRSRFIHDDDAGVDRERTRYGHQMLVGNAEFLQENRRIDPGSDPRKKILGLLDHRCLVDQAETCFGSMSDEDIFSDREIVEEHCFLVDRRHTRLARILRGREGNDGTADGDLAFIRLVNPGQNLDDGRFARPVLTDKGRDLSWIEIERDFGKSFDTGKGLRNALQRQDRLLIVW